MDATAGEPLPVQVIRSIAKELKSLADTPPEGIRIIVNEENISAVHAEIDGPVGTPYEGGLFRMKLMLSHEFPSIPPKGLFLTKIFHPNVAKNGEICVNVLKKDWKPDLGLRHVLIVVRCLLIEPYPESALNEEAGKMLLEDYDSYAKHARLMTSIHAVRSRPKGGQGAANASARNQAATGSASNTLPLAINSVMTNGGRSISATGELKLLSERNTNSQQGGFIHSANEKNAKGSRDVSMATAGGEKRRVDPKKRSLKRL